MGIVTVGTSVTISRHWSHTLLLRRFRKCNDIVYLDIHTTRIYILIFLSCRLTPLMAQLKNDPFEIWCIAPIYVNKNIINVYLYRQENKRVLWETKIKTDIGRAHYFWNSCSDRMGVSCPIIFNPSCFVDNPITISWDRLQRMGRDRIGKFC